MDTTMSETTDTDDSSIDAETTDGMTTDADSFENSSIEDIHLDDISEFGRPAYLYDGFDEFDTWKVVDAACDPITGRIHTDEETAKTVKQVMNAYAASHPDFDRDDLRDIANTALGSMNVNETPTEEFDFEAHDEGDEDDGRPNAERVAEDDDVLFAITREEPPAWAEAVRGFVIGLMVVALLDAAHKAYKRTTSDEETDA